jgi:hypothetical protein
MKHSSTAVRPGGRNDRPTDLARRGRQTRSEWGTTAPPPTVADGDATGPAFGSAGDVPHPGPIWPTRPVAHPARRPTLRTVERTASWQAASGQPSQSQPAFGSPPRPPAALWARRLRPANLWSPGRPVAPWARLAFCSRSACGRGRRGCRRRGQSCRLALGQLGQRSGSADHYAYHRRRGHRPGERELGIWGLAVCFRQRLRRHWL